MYGCEEIKKLRGDSEIEKKANATMLVVILVFFRICNVHWWRPDSIVGVFTAVCLSTSFFCVDAGPLATRTELPVCLDLLPVIPRLVSDRTRPAERMPIGY